MPFGPNVHNLHSCTRRFEWKTRVACVGCSPYPIHMGRLGQCIHLRMLDVWCIAADYHATFPFEHIRCGSDQQRKQYELQNNNNSVYHQYHVAFAVAVSEAYALVCCEIDVFCRGNESHIKFCPPSTKWEFSDRGSTCRCVRTFYNRECASTRLS